MSPNEFIDLPRPDDATNALYDACTKTANTLHLFLACQNELLFAGLASTILGDDMEAQRKQALLDAYTAASNALVYAIGDGKMGAPYYITKTQRAVRQLQHSIKANQFLITQESKRMRERIERIMRCVALNDVEALIDAHDEPPLYLIENESYVAH